MMDNTNTAQPLPEAIVRRQLAERQAMLQDYQRAVAYEGSQEFRDDLTEIFSAIGDYLPGEPAEKAVYLLARAETVARKIRARRELIDVFLGLERKLEKYRALLPPDSPLQGDE